MEQQTLLYDARFLETYTGSIITDPSIAIVELVANCWDAYATEVMMTRDEFRHIWRTFAYNRIAHGGTRAQPPSDVQGPPRPVFGKNGKGRFASFCCASEYLVTSSKNGEEFSCRVYRTAKNPLVIEEVSYRAEGAIGHGTKITGLGEIRRTTLSEERAREIVGSRFLSNPAFKVKIDNRMCVTFGLLARV